MITIEVQPPKDYSWAELLRFYCQQSEADNPALPFMASMWSYALNTGGLTGKQADSAMRYITHACKERGLSLEELTNEQ